MKPHPSPPPPSKARLGGTLLLSCFMQRVYPDPLGLCSCFPLQSLNSRAWAPLPAAAVASGGMAVCDRPWFSLKFTEQCSVGAY